MRREDLLSAHHSYSVEYRDESDLWWPLDDDSTIKTEITARNIAERHTRRTLQATRVILIETYCTQI